MGKAELLCPHCNTAKFKIESDKKTGSLKKLKGGKWEPLLTKINRNLWVKNNDLGIAILCKCGKYSFLHNFSVNLDDLKISVTMSDDRSLAIYCDTCKIAFSHSELICPTCGTEY